MGYSPKQFINSGITVANHVGIHQFKSEYRPNSDKVSHKEYKKNSYLMIFNNEKLNYSEDLDAVTLNNILSGTFLHLCS